MLRGVILARRWSAAWYSRSAMKQALCGCSSVTSLFAHCSSEASYDKLAPLYSEEENQTDANSSLESEMSFFLNDSVEMKSDDKQQKSEMPMMHMLSSTNKRLFGALLETAAEKKRRLKREEKSLEVKNSESKRKKKKKKPKLKQKPLIFNQSNCHLLAPYSDSEGSRPTSPFNKENIVIKKLPKTPFEIKRNNNVSVNTKPKKILITAEPLPEVNATKVTKINILTASKNISNLETMHNTVKKKKHEDEVSQNQSIHKPLHMEESDAYLQKTLQTATICEGYHQDEDAPSLICIDNSKFSAVPDSLDVDQIKNFPLFNDSSSFVGESLNRVLTEACDIQTIGIFDGGYQKLPSVRHILEETMPQKNKIALEKWKAKMIKELGEEGFIRYRQGLLDQGKLLHGCIQSNLSGITPSIEELPSISGFWTSLKHVFPHISDVKVLESRLIHPYLYYQGAVDCVGYYRNRPVLVEWKTSSKPKLSLKSMFDDPLQVIAYLGALNFDSNYQLSQNVDSAMLVIAYGTGLPAHVHIISKDNCQHYWKIWCTRLAEFWKKLELQT